MSIKKLFKSNKKLFILIFFMVFIGMAIDSLSQYLMTPAYNYLRNMNLLGFILFMCLALGCDAVRLGLISGSDYLYSKETQNYLHQIRKRIGRYFFKNDINQTAKVQNNMVANLDQLTTKYLTPIKNGFMYFLAVVFSIGILFSFNWILVVVTVILTIISLLLPKVFEKLTSTATVIVTKKNEKFLNILDKWVKGLDELRRYASFDIFTSSINNGAKEYKKAAIHQGATIAIADMATALVNIGGQMLLLGLCAYLYLQGRIAFGAVITTGQFSSTIMNGVAAFVAQWNLIKSTKGLNEEILELEQQVEIPKDQHDDQKVAKIEIRDLALQFKNGENISYPDLTFNKGEKILVTGDSGSGKSTLFKLILNKLTPSKGTIHFIDQDGKEIHLNPDEFVYLAQDSTLFPDTLENNITMFNAELNNQVKQATKKVDLDKDISNFPEGLATQVDLDKNNLSGGQKQKLVLARALVHNSPWLFIDEGTSAIDSESTKHILQNLLATDDSVIMIAHNFSNELVSMFDRVVKLDDGGTNQ